MFDKLIQVTEFLWGAPLMFFMVSVGLYFTIRTGFFQFTGVKFIWQKTIGELFKNKTTVQDKNEGTLHPFQALSAVLAGTVGGGSIAGVAAAIAIGGPGAVFWMWVIGLLGMMTKMVEVTLAVQYRKKSEDGEFYGGPMHYIREGIGGNTGKILGTIYAVALFVLVITDACFVQTNTLAVSANEVLNIPLIVSGIFIVGLSMILIMSGGIQKIGSFCGKIVPIMCIVYIVGALVIIGANISSIPQSFAMIFKYAFAPAPAVGGFVGSTISLTMARGASRGIFSNEAGMGTAATVHATAQTDHPVHQGLYGIFEIFVVTVIVCTVTALSILSSGVWSNGNTGVVLTFDAFRSVWGSFGAVILCIAVVLFTYSSYLGFYIEFRTCTEYLFGQKSIKYLKWVYFIMPIIAVTMPVEIIWSLADMAVGFIVVPNMIALILLRKKFLGLFKEYRNKALTAKK